MEFGSQGIQKTLQNGRVQDVARAVTPSQPDGWENPPMN